VTTVVAVPHPVTRLVFDTGQPYDQFRGRYEAAVPPADDCRPGSAGGRHARWRSADAETAELGGHCFVLHWRAGISPQMTAAGERRPRTAYLMGSTAIGQSSWRRNPAVLLSTPLRTLIYLDSDDRTRFAVEQPSTVLAGLADPGLADPGLDDPGLDDLGASLDRQLADLLDILGIQPTRALRGARPQRAATLSRIPRRAGAASGQAPHTNQGTAVTYAHAERNLALIRQLEGAAARPDRSTTSVSNTRSCSTGWTMCSTTTDPTGTCGTSSVVPRPSAPPAESLNEPACLEVDT
jgi:hypothetical protein